jgi:hypothetical protein
MRLAPSAARAAAPRTTPSRPRALGPAPSSPPRSRTNFDERGNKIDSARRPAALPRRIHFSGRFSVTKGEALGRFRLLPHAVRARDALEAAGGDIARVPLDFFGAVTAKNVAERERAAAQLALRADAGGGSSGSCGRSQPAPAPKRRRADGDEQGAAAATGAHQGARTRARTAAVAGAATV